MLWQARNAVVSSSLNNNVVGSCRRSGCAEDVRAVYVIFGEDCESEILLESGTYKCPIF